eukprot:GHVP01028743.1.p3 GENE.GHVP01028743.1~~GHVP01028743.1.p3  ORF type:complete len:171 (-),score=22.71 GHVP01028743.1:1243-1755(-)
MNKGLKSVQPMATAPTMKPFDILITGSCTTPMRPRRLVPPAPVTDDTMSKYWSTAIRSKRAAKNIMMKTMPLWRTLRSTHQKNIKEIKARIENMIPPIKHPTKILEAKLYIAIESQDIPENIILKELWFIEQIQLVKVRKSIPSKAPVTKLMTLSNLFPIKGIFKLPIQE